MALQLGLFSGVFETIQVLRDADEVAEEGVRTTAVALGKPRTLMLARFSNEALAGAEAEWEETQRYASLKGIMAAKKKEIKDPEKPEKN